MVAITCEGQNAFVLFNGLPERERAGSLHRELQRKSVHARCRWRRLMDRFHQVGTFAAVQFPLCLVHGFTPPECVPIRLCLKWPVVPPPP
jgi:hypothetical protein